MDELIRINYDSERPTVNGRDLHEALQVKTAYKDWFPRMCEYGFVEGRDFCSFLSESSGGLYVGHHVGALVGAYVGIHVAEFAFNHTQALVDELGC